MATPIIIDVPGVGPTEFPDEATAADYFKKNPPSENFEEGLVDQPDAPKEFVPSDYLRQLENQKITTNPTSKNYGNLLSAYEKRKEEEMQAQGIVDSTKVKTATPPKFSDKMMEKIQSIMSAQGSLKKLAELKNSGFGGQGIDTGPVVGGGFEIPFTDTRIPFVPAGVSEWLNSGVLGLTEDLGENAGDRGLLRQNVLDLANPVRKITTGASAATSELDKYIMPGVPNESDNDKTFFKKTLNSAAKSQQDLIDILTTLQKSGVDVSKFQEQLNISPESVVSDLMQSLAKNKNGSFNAEFPDGIKNVPGIDPDEMPAVINNKRYKVLN